MENKAILLVEDDPRDEALTLRALKRCNIVIRTMLKLLLTNSGYEVWETANGTRVCDMYQQQHFDLIITDLVMPDLDGLEVIMELRRRDQNVRIIAMSGVGQGRAEEYLRLAQKLGAQLTLSKPFGNQEFLKAVRLVLES
jgi:CheY-like chemotaxis protein